MVGDFPTFYAVAGTYRFAATGARDGLELIHLALESRKRASGPGVNANPNMPMFNVSHVRW